MRRTNTEANGDRVLIHRFQSQYVQLAVIPFAFTFFGFVGIAVTSAGMVLYDGQVLWNPLNLIDQWTNRPAAFFMAFSFALATLGTNMYVTPPPLPQLQSG